MHIVDATLFYSPTSGGVKRYLLAKHEWMRTHTNWRHSIVVPGETGWEIPTLSHQPLVDALEAALATPAERLAEMGRAGRAHVTARFAPRKDHVLDQMVAVYDELLAAG
jgi:glycosyltransferase involved in cell wall biosynthesis